MSRVERIQLVKKWSEQVKSTVCCFLIPRKDSKKYAIVDAGAPEHFDEIVEKIGDREIEYIILTHCHSDHAGCCKKLKEKYGAKVIVSQYENERLEKGLDSDLVAHTEPMKKFLASLPSGTEVVEKVRGDVVITDDMYENTKILGDYNLILYKTPGHTNGSMSIFCHDSGDLLVGDLLFPHPPPNNFGIHPFHISEEDFLKSIDTVLKLDGSCKRIFPAHFDKDISFDDFKKRFDVKN